MSKVRPDAFYARLSEQELDEMWHAVRALSLAQGCALVKEKYQCSCSKSALARFISNYGDDVHRQLREELKKTAARAQETAEAAPISARVIAESLRALGAHYVELGEHEQGLKYLQVAANQDRIASENEKLQLDREKFEATERRLNAVKGAVSDTNLTPEAREAKLKEIFGL